MNIERSPIIRLYSHRYNKCSEELMISSKNRLSFYEYMIYKIVVERLFKND